MRAAAAVACLVLLLGICGCGRKAKPEPLRKQAGSSIPFRPEARVAAQPGPPAR